MFKKLTLALALLCAHNASYSLTSQEENEFQKNRAVEKRYNTLSFACFSAGIICATLCKDLNPSCYYAGTSALLGMSVLCGYYSLQAERKKLSSKTER